MRNVQYSEFLVFYRGISSIGCRDQGMEDELVNLGAEEVFCTGMME